MRRLCRPRRREQIAGDDSGEGLTIFCPDDQAVAAFGPDRFSNLTADGQVALLLYHGVAERFESEEELGKVEQGMSTLASSRDYGVITVLHDDGGVAVILSSPQNEARVTKLVVDNDRLVVYLIDTVLVPGDPTVSPHVWAAVLAILCMIIVLMVL